MHFTSSAFMAKDFFLEKKVKDVLIPGFGYGRNAKIFSDNGMHVTGIEISKTAIDLARENGVNATIYHGSVTNMPFDNKRYDAIFCYALIHLLNRREREKLIQDCYNQLQPDGYMMFTAVTKKAPMYGEGRELSKDRFEIMEGVKMFYYDSNSVRREFEKYGLIEFSEIDEPNKNMKDKPAMNFVIITCKKGAI
ncbi:class I SAM-dependent methyltransferase [Paenibacillus popilliae]|uniref:Class I SAM-dependent methyltransferase n=1 Tax=Paenibacillus popilliae TaxID=78057 RepID=A0ABY3AU50_PAEPP|nr:class I SAM-dependent methyltransferase [Paenibacillus sp. SDF0028]TQR46352.1 class I SAM-dependent methyltransferase [Paenibacillus sp. SDF0028]